MATPAMPLSPPDAAAPKAAAPPAVGLTPGQYRAATSALFLTSLTSGATSMLLLLSSLKAGHSVWQTSMIFAAYQGASALAALGAGGFLAARGLRPVLVCAFLLQAVATAALIPLNAREREGPGVGVAWPLATATAYASAINAVVGAARVLARTASKALPKLAAGGGGAAQGAAVRDAAAGGAGGALKGTTAAAAAAATAAVAATTTTRASRTLMFRTALVTGGRTALKGAGSFAGGALAQHLPYPAAMGLLAAATLPAVAVAALAVPAGVGVAPADAGAPVAPCPAGAATAGKGEGERPPPPPPTPAPWWLPSLRRCLARTLLPSRPVAATSLAQALQNAGQFAWLQVPVAHLLSSRGAAFKFSRTATGGAVAGVMVWEGVQQLLTPRFLRALRQAPPHSTRSVVGLWGALAAAGGVPLILLTALSALARPGGGLLGPLAPRPPASASFFAALLASVAPTQVFAVLLSFTLQRVMDRRRIGATAGLNTAAQAAGRAGGVLVAGLLYGCLTGDWRGHAHARHDTDPLDGRPNDAGAPVGPFAAVMGFTVVCLVAAAGVARWGLPRGEEEGVRCGPCLGGGGGGGEDEEGGGARK